MAKAVEEDLSVALQQTLAPVLRHGGELDILNALIAPEAVKGSFRLLGGWSGLFAVAPVLLRLATSLIQLHQQEVQSFNRQVAALRKSGIETSAVLHVSRSLSDLHVPGGRVRRVEFASGASLIYKPRPLHGELLWNELCQWLSIEGGHSDMELPRCWSYDSHGWMDEIKSTRRDRESTEYYEQLGAYLALGLALGTSDLHRENFRDRRGRPVLVDCETVLQPSLGPTEAQTVFSNVDWLSAQLQRMCILRSEMPLINGGVVRVGILDRATFTELNEKDQCELSPTISEASIAGLCDGYRESVSRISRRRDELVELLSASPNVKEFRVVLLSTQAYTAIQRRALEPAFLTDVSKWMEALEYGKSVHLPAFGARRGHLIARAEAGAASRGAIPRFKMRARELVLLDENDHAVCALEGLPALDTAIARIADLARNDPAQCSAALRHAISHLSR